MTNTRETLKTFNLLNLWKAPKPNLLPYKRHKTRQYNILWIKALWMGLLSFTSVTLMGWQQRAFHLPMLHIESLLSRLLKIIKISLMTQIRFLKKWTS